MDNLGLYIRATEDEINIIIEILQRLNNIIHYNVITVKSDAFSHEYNGIQIISRKVYKGEKVLYIICKNEERRIHFANHLRELTKIKFDSFLEENLNIF